MIRVYLILFLGLVACGKDTDTQPSTTALNISFNLNPCEFWTIHSGVQASTITLINKNNNDIQQVALSGHNRPCSHTYKSQTRREILVPEHGRIIMTLNIVQDGDIENIHCKRSYSSFGPWAYRLNADNTCEELARELTCNFTGAKTSVSLRSDYEIEKVEAIANNDNVSACSLSNLKIFNEPKVLIPVSGIKHLQVTLKNGTAVKCHPRNEPNTWKADDKYYIASFSGSIDCALTN